MTASGLVLGLLLVWGVASLHPSAAVVPLVGLALAAILLEVTAIVLPGGAVVSAAYACYLAAGLHPDLGYGWAVFLLLLGAGFRLIAGGMPHPQLLLIDAGPILLSLATAHFLSHPEWAGFQSPAWLVALTALLVFSWARRALPNVLADLVDPDLRKEWEAARTRAFPLELASGLAATVLVPVLTTHPWSFLWLWPLAVALQRGLAFAAEYIPPEEQARLDRLLLDKELAIHELQNDLDRSRDELKRKFDDYATLQELSRTLIRIPEVERSLEALLDIVTRLVESTSTVIFLVEEKDLVPVRFRSPQAKAIREALLARTPEPLVLTAIRTGEPQQLTEASHPSTRLLEGEPSAAAFPLANLGVLYVGRARPGGFTDTEIRSLSLVAHQAPLAIQSARRYEAQRQATQLQIQARADLLEWVEGSERLLQGVREMAQLLDPQHLLSAVETTMKELVPEADRALVVLDPSGAPVAHSASPGLPEEVLERLAREGRPVFLEEEGRQVLALPLSTEDRPLGALVAAAPALSRKDRDLLAILAYQAAVMLANVQLHAETMDAYTKLQDSQAQLVQSSKLTAIGQMAAGVAHELNTPLGAVMIAIDYALLKIKDLPDVTGRLESAANQIERAQLITQKLLNFSRDARRHKTEVDLNRLLDETLEIIGYELTKSGVSVARDYGPLPLIQCVPNEIQQVVINLLLNARDALRDWSAQPVVTLATRPEGTAVIIEVRDPGPGIPAEDLEKIFEPFFTTKPVDKGTGLGLSVSRSIVENHGGKIWARSQPGVGTTFTVYLPVT